MVDHHEEMRTGHCLCGAVSYAVRGAPVVVAHCHCDDCQRLTGAGHSTGAMYAAGALSLNGRTSEFKLTSDAGNEVTRVFCPSCGSPILGRNTGMQGYVTLSLGTMDDSNGLEPEVVVFSRNRKSWDVMDESLQRFEGQPGWSPEDK